MIKIGMMIGDRYEILEKIGADIEVPNHSVDVNSWE